jgi:hypothetical protein
MTRREQVLTLIRAGVAKEGKATHIEIRLYVENRISFAAFRKAVDEGLTIHARMEARR